MSSKKKDKKHKTKPRPLPRVKPSMAHLWLGISDAVAITPKWVAIVLCVGMGAEVASDAITAGTVSVILATLAGKFTPGVSTVISWGVTLVATAAAFHWRHLYHSVIDQKASREQGLERLIDPYRTSSDLESDGRTNRKDRR